MGLGLAKRYFSLFHHSDQFDFCVFAMVHRLSEGAIMRTELFIFVLRKTSGSGVKFVDN